MPLAPYNEQLMTEVRSLYHLAYPKSKATVDYENVIGDSVVTIRDATRSKVMTARGRVIDDALVLIKDHLEKLLPSA